MKEIENNVDKYERLMILSPDHEFTKEDLNAILKKPSKKHHGSNKT